VLAKHVAPTTRILIIGAGESQVTLALFSCFTKFIFVTVVLSLYSTL
jgi:hypothetical protein